MRVTFVGSVLNLLLVVLKLVAGVVGHSAAMVSDAVHSVSDFVTDVVVMVFVNMFTTGAFVLVLRESNAYSYGA